MTTLKEKTTSILLFVGHRAFSFMTMLLALVIFLIVIDSARSGNICRSAVLLEKQASYAAGSRLGAYNEYYFIVEKDFEKVRLKVPAPTYNAFEEGQALEVISRKSYIFGDEEVTELLLPKKEKNIKKYYK